MRKFVINGMNIGYVAPDRGIDVSYDNTESELSSTTVQDAIDELNTIKTNETTSFTEASTRENISSGDTVTTIWGKIKKFFSDLKTVAFSGSYNDLDNKPTIPSKTSQLSNDSGYITTDATRVSKSGDTMSGTLTYGTENNVALDFRPNNAGYHTTVSYQTAGNEALVLATKNSVTSLIFVNGEDSIANHTDSRWKSLTPGLQIKNNKVAIGKLIPDGTTPTYALDINGDVRATTFDGNLKYTHTNEVNFGGGNQSTCYFNYRNADTDQAAAISSIAYKFCNYSNDTSKSNILAGSFNGYTIQKSVPSNAKFTDTVPDKLKRALLTQRTGTGTDTGLSIACNYSCLLLELTYYGSAFATSLIFNTSSGEQRVSGFVDNASNYVWAKVFITSGKITKLQLQNTNTSIVVDGQTRLNVYILSVST